MTKRQSISIGFENVDDPDQDWIDLASRLESVHANAVNISAGRVEFTGFDWPSHPDAAATPGRDGIAVALDAVGVRRDGEHRLVCLVIDTLIPNWIARDPSLAGRYADGTPTTYLPSASALLEGPVGARYQAYAVALARRYQPDQISFSELQLDEGVFGDDDLALFRSMTGAPDWPRTEGGGIDVSAPAISSWRTEVVARFLTSVRSALASVAAETRRSIRLALDVDVDWAQPGARSAAGDDYARLHEAAGALVLWAYLGIARRSPADVERIAAGVDETSIPPADVTLSIGLWAGTGADPRAATITPETLAESVAAARTHGVQSVNVTPVSLLTPAHWSALATIWTAYPA